jgi:hypothetical protein
MEINVMVARVREEFLPAEQDDLVSRPQQEELLEADPEDVAVQNVIADLGGAGADAKVNVYQLDENRSKSFVGSYLPTEFSLERVQDRYGPGAYEIHVRSGGKLATRKIIKIATPKIVETAPTNGIDADKLIGTMNHGFQQMGAMFAQALAGLAATQPKPKSTTEMLQEMALMKELMGGNQPPVPPQDPLAMINLAVELSEKIRPREGEPSAGEIILEAVKNFAPAINEMVAAKQAQEAPAMPVGMLPQHPVSPPPIPGPMVPVPASSPQMEQDEMNVAFQIYCRTLLGAAANDADPMTYANNILDLAQEDQVLAFVNRSDWFSEVVRVLPDAAKFAPWFGQLRTDILELTKPEDAPSVEATQAKPVP